MKLRCLHDPLLGLLYEDDDIIAVDKPYGVDSHTNDSKTGNEGYIVPGLIEIFEANLGRPLHIIHRLDRTTTGVIVFGKSLESAKKYQQFFRNRESKKTYQFLTAARSERGEYETAQPILHKGDELDASTSFKRVKTALGFELWEAHPHTGRNHQIRIHGAQVGLPLLGDEKYGGAKYPFLCLHNRRLRFPNGVEIESRAPIYFEDLKLLEDQQLARVVHEIDRRKRLFPTAFASEGLKNECLRLSLTDIGSGRSSLDLFGHGALLTWNDDAWSATHERIYQAVAKILSRPIKVRFTSKNFRDANGKAGEKLLGPVPEQATEIATGVFADQRLHRHWLSANSKDKTVLVLFSSAGAHAIAAAAGGASQITCVEANKFLLNLARTNFELSAVSSEKTKFLNRESLAFLDQCKTKDLKFDLIVCDAPSFSRGEKRNFKIESDYQELLTKALTALNPSGSLLFSIGSPALFPNDVRLATLKAQASLGLKALSIASLQSPLDCELPGEPAALKSLMITRDGGES